VFSFDLASPAAPSSPAGPGGDRDAAALVALTRERGRVFIEALQIFSHLANVGDCRSLVIHPASTTHLRMDAAALAASGIGAGTIRLSIGLEDVDDLIADLDRALKLAAKVGAARPVAPAVALPQGDRA
jgi:hypothetical protein